MHATTQPELHSPFGEQCVGERERGCGSNLGILGKRLSDVCRSNLNPFLFYYSLSSIETDWTHSRPGLVVKNLVKH